MFFVLMNPPATFQHTMDCIFQPLMNEYSNDIDVYMDDIFIKTHPDLELHREIMYKVLDLLEKELFFLKPSKCKFKQQSIDYLGICIEKGVIHIDPTKRDGLADWPQNLHTVKQVHNTLGVLGYQQPFIQDFAKLAKALTSLLKKGVPFNWTEECTCSLDALLKVVTSDSVLHWPDYSKPFFLEVDASQYATGAILHQTNNEGHLCPVGYHSHMLNEAKQGYNIHD
jgi:hypothetical protein